MTIITLISIIFILILSASIIFFVIKKRQVYLFATVTIFVIGGIFFAINLGNVYPQEFNGVNMDDIESLDSVVIQYDDDIPYLYDSIDNQRLVLTDFRGDVKHPNQYPVYLRDLNETFYLIIFSFDSNQSYDSGYFRQSDYERYSDCDYLALLNKETGDILRFQIYESIGYKIDLSLVQATTNSVSIPMVSMHEINLYFIFTLFFDLDHFAATDQVVFNHEFITGVFDDTFIAQYALSNDNQMIYRYADGTVMYGFYQVAFSNNSSYISYNDRNEVFEDELYVSQGYFTLHEGKIYFVNNDLELCYLSESNQKIYVTDISKKNFEI